MLAMNPASEAAADPVEADVWLVGSHEARSFPSVGRWSPGPFVLLAVGTLPKGKVSVRSAALERPSNLRRRSSAAPTLRGLVGHLAPVVVLGLLGAGA